MGAHRESTAMRPFPCVAGQGVTHTTANCGMVLANEDIDSLPEAARPSRELTDGSKGALTMTRRKQ